MKKLICVMLLLIPLYLKSQNMVVTNEIDMTVDSSSYDTQQYILWLAYLASGFHNMYPQYTNSINSISRSGASLQNQFESQQEMYALPHWCYAFYTNHVTPYDLMLANDNGGYNAATTYQWMTNLFGAPGLTWNGVAKTNEGLVFSISHYTPGANINSVVGGDSGAVARNTGASNAMVWIGKTPIDGWHDIFTNITSAVDLSDVSGTNMFYALGHLTPQMALAQMIATWRGLGLPTNVAAITFDFNVGSVASVSNFTATGIAHSSVSFSCTLTSLRLPPSWDIVAVISNNVATQLWTNMPSYGSFFQQTIQFTNIPPGTYNMYLGGILVDTCTDTQLKASRNMATNEVPTNPWNVQRTSVLYKIRDKYGVDHSSGFNTHGAGENGINGPDQINYQSLASSRYVDNNERGSNQVKNVGVDIASLRNNYDVPIRTAAQPQALSFQLINVVNDFQPAPFR